MWLIILVKRLIKLWDRLISTNSQTSRICKAFASGKSANINFSKKPTI